MSHDLPLHPYDLIIPMWMFAAIVVTGSLVWAWQVASRNRWLVVPGIALAIATIVNAQALNNMNDQIKEAAVDTRVSILHFSPWFVVLSGVVLLPTFIIFIYMLKHGTEPATWGWLSMFVAAAVMFGHTCLYSFHQDWWELVGGIGQFLAPIFAAAFVAVYAMERWDRRAQMALR